MSEGTQKQKNYARVLGIDHPESYSKDELRELITLYKNNQINNDNRIEMKARADSCSIEMLAERLGYHLISKRSYLEMEEHDSCQIRPYTNRFKRWSTGASGKAVSFLMEFGEEATGNRRFRSVDYSICYLCRLLDREPELATDAHAPVQLTESRTSPELKLPERADTDRKAVEYLEGRGIYDDVIGRWLDNGWLYQGVMKGRSEKTGREYSIDQLVFVSYDDARTVKRKIEDMKPVFASVRSIGSRKFVRDVAGSDYSKGQMFINPLAGTLHFTNAQASLVVCEAPIDIMSVQSIFGDLEYYKRAHYLSLNGVAKQEALYSQLRRHKEIGDVTVMMDNDEAGISAAREIIRNIHRDFPGLHVSAKLPPSEGMDWNDELRNGYNRKWKQDLEEFLSSRNISMKEWIDSTDLESRRRIVHRLMYPLQESRGTAIKR